MEVIRRKEVHVNCVLDITYAGRKEGTDKKAWRSRKEAGALNLKRSYTPDLDGGSPNWWLNALTHY